MENQYLNIKKIKHEYRKIIQAYVLERSQNFYCLV